MVMRIKCALWRQVSHNYSEAHRSLCPSFSDRFTCKLCLLRVILIFSQVWVPDWCCILHVGPYNGYSWWKVCCSTFWQNWRYNRPKILFAFIHTPSICFDQDRSDVSKRPKYLNIARVSSICPKMVIVGGLFILFCLNEISINLHLERLRNMRLQFMGRAD